MIILHDEDIEIEINGNLDSHPKLYGERYISRKA